MSMEEHQQEIDGLELEANRIKRHRWTALWNGVVIGMGVSMLLTVSPLGVIPLVMGIGLEVVHRRRLNRRDAPPE